MLEDLPSTAFAGESVKLVIWDLDDTFWSGTLLEGSIRPIAENVDLVKALAARGIISSIASKNDRDAVAKTMRLLGVWDYFVAPAISFQSKGGQIAALIAALQLRPANVVFIDDNPSVLAEAGFTCPGLICLDSPAKLAAAMDEPALRGSDDAGLTRLTQYRQLAERLDLKRATDASDETFLRQSGICVEIDYAVEPQLDRVIELINRSNQLNYTKRRVETDEAQAELRENLHKFGFNAGIVRVSDKYGDYGIVGFFLTLATLRGYELQHFVFSCRIMNMGIEQYVFDYLNRPEINVVAPVANPIASFPVVDWITEGAAQAAVSTLRNSRLVLIGGCDMLQLSTYCSMQSVEFTNRDEKGLIKRLDDPFFLLETDIEKVRRSRIRPLIPAFNADDMLELGAALESADALVVSFYRMMEINYFRGSDDLMIRLDEDAVTAILRSERALWFIRNFSFVQLSHQERNDLVRRSLWRLAERTPPGCKIVVLLENLRKQENNPNAVHLRTLYNTLIEEVCSASHKFTALDINAVTSEEWVFDDGFHMKRQGYFELAQAVKNVIGEPVDPGV